VFVADEERRVAHLTVKCATKLAGLKGRETVVYLGRHRGTLTAVEPPKQEQLFPEPKGRPGYVPDVPDVEIEGAESEEGSA
jgi:hypothetical protein